MASIHRDAEGVYVRFTRWDRKRKKIHLGVGASDKFARQFAEMVGRLNDAQKTTLPLDPVAAAWLVNLPDEWRRKLERVGLVQPVERTHATLANLLDEFFKHVSVRASTRVTYAQTRRALEGFFKPDRLIGEIRRLDADRWRQSMIDDGLSEATVAKRVKTARQMFRAAVGWELIASNPFEGVKAGAQKNRARLAFVPTEDVERIIAACPDHEWRLIVALARYGALRCPSEILALRWEHVAWDRSRLIVPCVKTSGHEGREFREVPIFPELLPHLRDAFERADAGTEWVIARYRGGNANLRTQFERIIVRAGVKPWPRLFQNLRASRSTELAGEFGSFTAAQWCGHDTQTQSAHYLTVREADFTRAVAERTAVTSGPKSGPLPGQNPGHHGDAPERTDTRESAETLEFAGSVRSDALVCASSENEQVTPMGFEPMSSP